MALQDERYFALRDLVLTLPPTSLAECAIQLQIANALAVHLEGDEPDREEKARSLERITVSVIPVIAAAELEAVVAEYRADICVKPGPCPCS